VTPRSKVKSIKGFVMSRKNVIHKEGTAAERVAALVGNLKQEGIL